MDQRLLEVCLALMDRRWRLLRIRHRLSIGSQVHRRLSFMDQRRLEVLRYWPATRSTRWRRCRRRATAPRILSRVRKGARRRRGLMLVDWRGTPAQPSRRLPRGAMRGQGFPCPIFCLQGPPPTGMQLRGSPCPVFCPRGAAPRGMRPHYRRPGCRVFRVQSEGLRPSCARWKYRTSWAPLLLASRRRQGNRRQGNRCSSRSSGRRLCSQLLRTMSDCMHQATRLPCDA